VRINPSLFSLGGGKGLPRPDKSGLAMTENKRGARFLVPLHWEEIKDKKKTGLMNQAPTLGRIRKDKGVITPTFILPPRRGRRCVEV